jgi:hypothetical protein
MKHIAKMQLTALLLAAPSPGRRHPDKAPRCVSSSN